MSGITKAQGGNENYTIDYPITREVARERNYTVLLVEFDRMEKHYRQHIDLSEFFGAVGLCGVMALLIVGAYGLGAHLAGRVAVAKLVAKVELGLILTLIVPFTGAVACFDVSQGISKKLKNGFTKKDLELMEAERTRVTEDRQLLSAEEKLARAREENKSLEGILYPSYQEMNVRPKDLISLMD